MNHDVLRRILRVIAYGSAVVAAGVVAPSCGDDGDASTETPQATAQNDEDDAQTYLEMESGMLECTGGYTEWCGPCCPQMFCHTSAVEECPTVRMGDARQLPDDFPRPAETCSVQGPFNPDTVVDPINLDTVDPTAQSSAECCYLIGTRSCTGRPLTCGDGEIRVAPVAERGDWV